jgi:hypothetical protein
MAVWGAIHYMVGAKSYLRSAIFGELTTFFAVLRDAGELVALHM